MLIDKDIEHVCLLSLVVDEFSGLFWHQPLTIIH